jgi:ComF family protein
MVYGWLERFFEERCPGCDGETSGGFCVFCAQSFRRIEVVCHRCGLAQPVASCPRRTVDWQVDAVAAPLDYAPPLDFYVQSLKYRGARSLARAFALLLAPTLSETRGAVDALVAVPLHGSRLRERGYNQAFEFARYLSAELRLPLLSRGIARRAADESQTKRRGARARRAGIADAFSVRRAFEARRIAIVDDVITTGATVNALAAELRRAGAASCVAWAIARTPAHTVQPRNV